MLAALYGAGVILRVPNVSRHHPEMRMRRLPGRTEKHPVIDHDAISGFEEFRNQDAPFIASAPGDQDIFHGGGNESSS
jgi:hypothetical protein